MSVNRKEKEISWDTIYSSLKQSAKIINSLYSKKDKFNLRIYGIPQGGKIPAAILSYLTGIRQSNSEIVFNYTIIIVDDLIDSGNTYKHFINKNGITIEKYVIIGNKNTHLKNNRKSYPKVMYPENMEWDSNVYIVHPWEIE